MKEIPICLWRQHSNCFSSSMTHRVARRESDNTQLCNLYTVSRKLLCYIPILFFFFFLIAIHSAQQNASWDEYGSLQTIYIFGLGLNSLHFQNYIPYFTHGFSSGSGLSAQHNTALHSLPHKPSIYIQIPCNSIRKVYNTFTCKRGKKTQQTTSQLSREFLDNSNKLKQ